MSNTPHWRPRDGWIFTGLGVLFAILFASGNFALGLEFQVWFGFLRLPAVIVTLFIFNLAVVCGISIFLSQVKSFADFKLDFDLTKPRETELLAAVAIGVGLQYALIFVFAGNFSHLHLAHSFNFKKLPALFSPFLEEIPMRGFVYKAFRNAYGIPLSVCLTVVINLIFHTQIYGSAYQFVGITTLNTVLCLIKEKRPNLWNCIACHFAFNAIFFGIDQK